VRRLLLLLSLAGCNGAPYLFEGGDCALSVPFDPGTFRSTGGGDNGSPFAHARAGAKVLVLEQRDDGGADVTITYQRDGKTIVERWKSTDRVPWTRPPRPPARAFLAPSAIDFGPVPVGGQRDFIATLQNAGTGTGSPVLAVTGGPFELAGNSCPTLNAGMTCLVTVRFRPREAGSMAGTLKAAIVPGPETSAELRGVGVVPDAGALDAGAD
jgi:hypothetical protein